MHQEIIIDSNGQEIRVAILEESQLVEYYVQRSSSQGMSGNIYKGIVRNIVPGMQAAFVDIGTGRNAFLYLPQTIEAEGESAGGIPPVVEKGQEILVQVHKEAMGGKGAKVTTQITLPGRFLVLLPHTDHVGVSHRIADQTERERLRRLAEEMLQPGLGMIVRTAAEGANIQQLREDYTFLQGMWQHIKEKYEQGKAPQLIFQELDLLSRVVRDFLTSEVQSLVISGREAYATVCALLAHVAPQWLERVKEYRGEEAVFRHFSLEREMERAIKRKVWLKSGGYLVIDQLEALTAIDVNSGKFVGKHSLEETVLALNLEAAREIARQIRLRDIGGIIIIDFIDMAKEDHRRRVLLELEEALRRDRTYSQILGFTQLGLVELTRKRVRQSLAEVLQKRCPCCEGTGRVRREVLFD